MQLEYIHHQLKFRYPFKLASGSREYTDTIIVKLQHEGTCGYGEASLPPYLNENTESVIKFLSKIELDKLEGFHNIEEVLQYVDSIEEGNSAAKSAIDIALNDLRGKILNKSIGYLYHIEWKRPVYSTHTIGISSEIQLLQKLSDSVDFNVIKLKLGSDDDRSLIENYLKWCDKPFCVDVNQGWKDKYKALEMMMWLAEKDVLFVEQPMPVDMIDETAWLTEKCPVPVIADESVQRLKDVAKLKGVFSGINIKLMKSTGINEALKMIEKGKELGFKILVGCMAESSCAVTAAAHLSPLADWVDLDSPKLIVNDPFQGVSIDRGEVDVPGCPGIGVKYLH